MTSNADAKRIAAGSPPSQFVAAPGGASGTAAPHAPAPYDPLRLCIFATIALLGWLGGPVTLIVFSVVGFAGYWRAWRGGLKTSKCWLRDTRLVLAYLATLFGAGLWGAYALLASITGR